MRRTQDEIRRDKEMSEYSKREARKVVKRAELLAMSRYEDILIPTDKRCKHCGHQYGIPKVEQSWVIHYYCTNHDCGCRAEDYEEFQEYYHDEDEDDKLRDLVHVLETNKPMKQESIDVRLKEYANVTWRPTLGEPFFYWGYVKDSVEPTVYTKKFEAELFDLLLFESKNFFKTAHDCFHKKQSLNKVITLRKKHFKEYIPKKEGNK